MEVIDINTFINSFICTCVRRFCCDSNCLGKIFFLLKKRIRESKFNCNCNVKDAYGIRMSLLLVSPNSLLSCTWDNPWWKFLYANYLENSDIRINNKIIFYPNRLSNNSHSVKLWKIYSMTIASRFKSDMFKSKYSLWYLSFHYILGINS